MSRLRTVIRPFLPRHPMTAADRWITLMMWTTGMTMGWSQGEASALLPFTRHDLALTEGSMSLVLAIARLAAFGAVFIGATADRVGRRRPLVLSLGLLLSATGAAALAPNAIAYTFAQAFARVGGAAVAALAVVVLAETVSPGVRAYAISFFGASASLGAGLSLLTLPLAEMTTLGWRLPHALPAVLILLIPFLWKSIPETPLILTAHPDLPWRDLLRGDRGTRFMLVASAGLLASAFSAVGLAFTTERLIADLGFSATAAVAVALIGGTVGALGFFVGGRLADSWGRRPTSVLSLMLALVGGIALYRVVQPGAVIAAAAVSAFGSFSFIPAGGAHRAELFPTSLRAAAGTAVGYMATVGSALGLMIGTITIDRIGLPATMSVLGIGMVAAAVLTYLLPETLGQDLSDV